MSGQGSVGSQVRECEEGDGWLQAGAARLAKEKRRKRGRKTVKTRQVHCPVVQRTIQANAAVLQR